jgi:exosortase K
MSALRAQLARHWLALPALLVAALLKWHYSHATADELRWILAPTSWVTALVLRSDFAFYVGEGYLSRERSILVSPACAGVNFLIVALLSLTLGFGHYFSAWRQRLCWLGAASVVAYSATVIVNTLRISLSVGVAHLAAQRLGLTFQEAHRLLGIVVYLAGLLVLCLTFQLWLSSRRASRAYGSPTPGRRAALLVALACYVGVTLVVPLLRGGAHNPEYWSHAAPVSVVVGVVGALLFAARGRTWDDGRHALSSPEHTERVAP